MESSQESMLPTEKASADCTDSKNSVLCRASDELTRLIILGQEEQ